MKWKRPADEKASSTIAILTGLFAASVVMTNAVSGNVINAGPFTFVAGTLLYPVTFLLTDVLSEVFGKRTAQRAVWTGLGAQALAVFFVWMVLQFDSIDTEMSEAFEKLFAPVPRIVLGSMIAYLISQTLDVRIFHWIKKKTNKRWLWLRNNGSTMISQLIDTFVFVTVAFFGRLDAETLIAMMAGQYTAKALLAAIDTPFCYLAVNIVRKKTGVKHGEYERNR